MNDGLNDVIGFVLSVSLLCAMIYGIYELGILIIQGAS